MPSPQKIKMYYDPRGNVIRTVNPDNSEQWVVHGRPDTLNSIALNSTCNWEFINYTPTPWEAYTYDANDLSTLTNGISYACDFTPKNAFVDPMGRAVKAIDRLSQSPTDQLVMRNTYDIRGNVLTVTDALNRTVFQHKYGIAKQPLWNNHIDSGQSTSIGDAAGKPIEANDAKGAKALSGYDVTSRPLNLWARDNGTASFALRNVTVYGDSLGITAAAAINMLGKPYQHYDEAGLNQLVSCDFKGNPLSKIKQVISDATLLGAGTTAYQVDWTNMVTSILDSTQYTTSIVYDALNRGIQLTLPADINNFRSVIVPTFNRAGALQTIQKDGTTYVAEIAYNAKGQQILAAWNNGIMMRFVHDPETFRLVRVKAEKYTFTQTGNQYQYAYNSGTTVYDQSYNYDLVGNILNVSDQTPDCGITGNTDVLNRLFQYDALYRLIYANGREMHTQADSYLYADAPAIGSPTASDCRLYTEQYVYDQVGNIQKLQHTASGNLYTRQFSYNSANNQVTQISNPSGTIYANNITYDAVGNTLTSNNQAYTWNYKNQMKTFSLLSGSGSVSTYAQYLYDASGARVKKFVLQQSGAYESVTYIDGVFEYDTSVSAGGGTIQMKNYIHLMGGVETRIGSFTGDINNTVLYQISDYLGSAGTRLDINGNIIDKEEYYPYGDSSLRTFTSKRYRYIGKEKDNESGLYQMGARYYAPWMCKFLSVDPLAAKYAQQSSYCYGNCNPLFFSDPSGMEPPQQGGGNSSGGSGATYQWSSGSAATGTQGLANGGNAANTNAPQNVSGPSSYVSSSSNVGTANGTSQPVSPPPITQPVAPAMQTDGQLSPQGEKITQDHAISENLQYQKMIDNQPVLMADASGKGIIGPKTYVEARLADEANDRKNQEAAIVASGPFAAGTYLATGNMTYTTQAALIDNAAAGVGGNRITLETVVTLPEVPVTSAPAGGRPAEPVPAEYKVEKEPTSTKPTTPASSTSNKPGLDWSEVSKKGETREQHVNKHGQVDATGKKDFHGVFSGDPITMTNQAWAKGTLLGIAPERSDGADLYHVPWPNAGTGGGKLDQGAKLDFITIIVILNTNKIITAYPSNGRY